ncbi:MAG TPA: hypothetical protein VIF57_03150 [Polyangia bacterium]
MPPAKTSPLDRAGFVVPYGMQTWRSFVEGGDLGRTLVRLCVLAGRAVPLSFVLERGPAASVTVVFVLRGESFEVSCGSDLLEESAADGLALILRGLNGVLAARGVDRRFVFDEQDHRLVLLDARGAAWAAQRSWLAEKCLPPEPAVAAKEPSKSRALPALPTPEQIVPPRWHFAADAGYPALLADYFMRLAAFARVGPVTCVPTPSLAPLFRNDEFFSLRVTWTHPSGGSVQETVRIRPGTRVPLQPICDAINRGLDMAGRRGRKNGARLQAYLCVSSPWGQHVVLATAAEAARLRRHAYLIEPEPAAPSIKSLGDGGIQLPYLGGFWRGWWQLDRCLTRTCLLAHGHIALSFATAWDGDGGAEIRYRAGDATAAYRYPARTGKEEVVDVLPRVYRDLNAFVGAQGVAHRFVMMKAEPHWYTPRLLLLDPAAIAAIRNAPGTYLDCLPPEVPGPLLAPTRHPERAVVPSLDRVPTVAEIVGERQVLESDFKCASRESDYPSLVEELARFANVPVEVERLAVANENVDHYDVRVSHDGVGATIRLDNQKYAQVGPIVDYLNSILAARRDERALYRFTAGSFESGVLLATPAQADQLRAAAYLVEARDQLI